MDASILESLPLCSAAEVGKRRRLARIFPGGRGKTVIVPVDDSLIFGPSGGLEELHRKLPQIAAEPPDALLTFPGVVRAHHVSLADIAVILNLTASTSRSAHTRKVKVGSVAQAVQLGADAVAVHVNISSRFEAEMLRTLGSVSQECDSCGMPLLAIMYPRSESESGDNNYEDLKEAEPARYAELVAHSARIAVDLGADIIKTKYTGDPGTFSSVVDACRPIPIVVAGGPAIPMNSMLHLAHGAMTAGGAGISFGRNVFSRDNPRAFLVAIKAVVHGGCSPDEAMAAVEGLPSIRA